MRRFVVLDKKVGDTPLMALQAWKKENPEYIDVPASYAGRLDPMASGKLLILLGEECKKQDRYTGLDKEYEIEVLLDVGSDTGDALGMVTERKEEVSLDQKKLQKLLVKEKGTHVRAYPAYSSKTVNGKPLFLYALEGKLDDIEIPTHQEKIHTIKLLNQTQISSSDLKTRIQDFLARVPKTEEPSKMLGADFRIDAVRASWERALVPERTYLILRLQVVCGSGTYMRTLAGRIGEALGTRGLALSIHRTKIGRYWGGWWVRAL